MDSSGQKSNDQLLLLLFYIQAKKGIEEIRNPIYYKMVFEINDPQYKYTYQIEFIIKMELLKMGGEKKKGGKVTTKVLSKGLLLNILENCCHIPKDEKLILRRYLQALQEPGENNKVVNILSCKILNKREEIILRKQAQKIRREFQSTMIAHNFTSQLHQNGQFKSTSLIKNKSNIGAFEFTSRGNQTGFLSRSTNKQNKHSSKQKHQQDYHLSTQKSPLRAKQSKIKALQNQEHKINTKKQGKDKDQRIKIWLKCKNNSIKHNQIQTQSSNSLRSRQFDRSQTEFEIEKKDFQKTKSLKNLFQQKKKQKFICSQSGPNSSMQSQRVHQNRDTDREAFKIYNFKSEQSLSNLNEQEEPIEQSTLKLPFSIRNGARVKHKGSIDASQSFNSTFLKQKITAEDLIDLVRSQRNMYPFQFQISWRQLNEIISMYTDWNNLDIKKSLPNKESLNFQDFVAFLEDNVQMSVKNKVRQLFKKMERKIFSSRDGKVKRISVLEFKSAFSNYSQWVKEKFEGLVKAANRETNSISYWQFYWLKDTQQFLNFEKAFAQVN